MSIKLYLALIAFIFASVQLYLHGKYFLLMNRAPAGELHVTDAVGETNDVGKVQQQQRLETSSGGGALQQQLQRRPGQVQLLGESLQFGPGTEDGGCVVQHNAAGGGPPPGVVAAVVVVTCCREHYLERTLNALVDVWGQDAANAAKFPLFVSQDGNNSQVTETLHSYTPPISVLQHMELKEPVRELNSKENLAYYRIANHYKFVFQQFFDCLRYPALVVVEDDMEVAVDFFSYFEAGARLLENDPSLYVVSSWNDHGQERYVRDPYRIYRTDFFPGLGWMMPSRLWDEFRALGWPHAYWDDWMRLSHVRRGRQSIFPEVCRNYNFGEHGSSKGQYFRQFLKPIKLNTVPVPWASTDLSYLLPDRYASDMKATLAGAKTISSPMEARSARGDVKLYYSSERQYRMHARSLRMLPDLKDGVPRAAYNGTVTVHVNEARLFLVKSPSFAPDPPTKPNERLRRRQARNRRAAVGGGGS